MLYLAAANEIPLRNSPDMSVEELLSINSLLDLIRPLVRSSGEIQLYPIWDLEEDKPPKGTIEWPFESLRADTLFFHEQFLHRVCS